MKEFDYSTNKIRANLNSNTTDYVNMFTSLFLIVALSILIFFVSEKPNASIYIPLIAIAIGIFLFHGLYKLVLIAKRKDKLAKLIDNDETINARVESISLECHRGRYDVHTLLSFIRVKANGINCYGVLPEALPIKRFKLYKKINELIKGKEIEIRYFKNSKIIDLSYGALFEEIVELSELK